MDELSHACNWVRPLSLFFVYLDLLCCLHLLASLVQCYLKILGVLIVRKIWPYRTKHLTVIWTAWYRDTTVRSFRLHLKSAWYSSYAINQIWKYEVVGFSVHFCCKYTHYFAHSSKITISCIWQIPDECPMAYFMDMGKYKRNLNAWLVLLLFYCWWFFTCGFWHPMPTKIFLCAFLHRLFFQCVF